MKSPAGHRSEAAAIAILALMLAALAPVAGYGAGTPAGTVISCQATISYKYGSDAVSRRVSSNVVSVTVAQVAAGNLAPATGTDFVPLNAFVDYPFSLVNSGNGTDRFAMSLVSSLGLSAHLFVDANGNQVLDPAEVAAGPTTQTPDLLEDRSMNFVLRVYTPDSTSLIGKTDVLSLTCLSSFDPAKRAALSRSTTITGAVLTLLKSVDRTVPRAGERVTYTIAHSNAGNLVATGGRLTDLLDPRLRYVTGSASPAPDSAAGQLLRWNSLTTPPRGTGYIMFQVDILNNVPGGTEIHNVVAGQYMNGQIVREITSTEQNFMTVGSSGSVTVDVGPDTSANAEPGDTLQYAFLIVNNGALPEAFDLQYTSTQGLAWTFHEDASGAGRVGPGAPAITSTGPISGGSRYPFVAKSVVPRLVLDQSQDFTTFQVRSSTNETNIKTVHGSTTMGLPKMSLVKSASAPDGLPGSEITYTITFLNTGHGGAYGFAVSDSIPVNTSYIPQSTTLNGIPRTDEPQDDEVTFDGGVVTVNVGSVAPGTQGTIAFRVKIL